MANRIQVRRGTAAHWASSNPVLADGEPGLERDTGKQKFGDGTSAWNDLPYASAGPQGPAGVASDSSVKDLITTPGTETATALSATYADRAQQVAPTEGHQRNKYNSNQNSKVVLTGHSLMYGQDTSGTGTLPATNGATQTRSSDSIPERLAGMLGIVAPGTYKPTVVNQGFPGDRTTEILNRWAAGESGDVEIIWADTNDAKNFGAYASGPVTPAQSAINLRQLIERAISRGAQPLVLGGAPIDNGFNSAEIYAIAEAQRQVCERLSVPYVDVSALLTSHTTAKVWTDTVHLTPSAYALIAAKLGAYFGPKGFNPPKVGPGRVILPKHNLHAPTGATVQTRTGATDGQTISVPSGTNIAFAVDVVEPCDVIVKFHSEAGVGVGNARIYYAQDKAGVPFNPVNIPVYAGRATTMRGPRLGIGPDVIVISGTGGTMEIDSIHFVPVRRSNRRGLDANASAARTRESTLAGAVLQSGGSWTNTFDSRCDEYTPLNITEGNATNRAGKIAWDVGIRFPASGSTTGPVAYASMDASKDHLVGSGYLLLCGSAGELVIREITPTGATDLQTVAGAFGAGPKFAGTVVLDVTSAGLAQVYIDGVAVGTTWTPQWKVFMPGAVAQSSMAVRGCSVTGYVGLV